MANRLISPSLADIDQDIAGVIPVDLILRWSLGQKNQDSHQLLLTPFQITGTVISSDSAGLSKLTQDKTLFEVMKLVSQPKELLFNYGSAIGGKGIGTWAADNTQMFYDQSIEPAEVLHQMIAAQREISQLTVQIGLGLHYGTYLQIGGGLFGEAAEQVETLAENFTKGSEIVLTTAFRNKLGPHLKQAVEERTAAEFEQSFYSFNYDQIQIKPKKAKGQHYPFPFTQDFFELLQSAKTDLTDSETYQKYVQQKIVILVKIVHQKKSFLLDTLSDWTLANLILTKIKRLTDIEEIKSNGSLGIFITDNVGQAIEFAADLKDTMAANGFTANVGITKGEILVFPLDKGLKEIAGGPVNIASKLAEDAGEKGKVLIEDTVNLSGQAVPASKKFSIKLSAIELKGIAF